MKSRKIRALIISLVICAIFTGGYYGYNKFATNTKAATSNYKEVTAKKMNIEIGIQGTGSVYAGISKDIVSNNSGTIGDLNLKIGDKVEAGSKLFVSNSEDLINSMNTAQKNLDEKKLNLQDDTTSYNDSLGKANTAISEAKNQLNSAKDAVNKMNVTSPISGTIVAVNNKNGDSVKINSISSSSSGNEGGIRTSGSKSANTGSSAISAGTGAVLVIADKDNPSKTVQVLPNNDGVIKNLNIKVGDSVQAGQVLFASDSDSVRQNVQKAQSNLDQQTSSLTDLKNSKKLEIESLDINDAEIQLDAAKDAVNKMTVTSPISGLIVAVNKSNGDSVSGTTQSSTSSSTSSQSNLSSTSNSGNSTGGAVSSNSSSKSTSNKSTGGMSGGSNSVTSTSSVTSSSNTSTSGSSSQTTDSVLTIVDPSSIKVKVAVDELDIAKIKEGQKAEIRFDAISDKVYEGTVETIPQNGTTTNGVTTYDVVVSIKETDGIKIGMSANVNILVDSKADTLAVPADAVIEKDDKKYVMDENHNLIEVKTGIENEKYIEILEGIKEEEKLLST